MNEKKLNKINVWILKEKEKKDLEEKIAVEISKKYNIEKKEALRLIRSETLESLDSLRSQIDNSDEKKLNKLPKKELENLFLTLKWAQEIIWNLSQLELVILKEELENTIITKNILEDYLPKKLVDRAKNPEKLHEHILGFSLWTANSIIAIVDTLYQIWAGIIKAPYHIYLVISWKAEIEWYDEI